MPFAYYARLTRAQQRTYRHSDAIGAVPLRGAGGMGPAVEALARALASGERGRCEAAAQGLLDRLTADLRVPPVRVQVLAARPARQWGELHGLYTPSGGAVGPRITLWMRTARLRRVVAPRTFLRTLVHELCHHLDYELLRLPDSFHTEGFYRRESSLMRQLAGGEGQGKAPLVPAPVPASGPRPRAGVREPPLKVRPGSGAGGDRGGSTSGLRGA